MFHLIVRIAFDHYKVGDRITDPALVAQHNASPFVTRVFDPIPNTLAIMPPEDEPVTN